MKLYLISAGSARYDTYDSAVVAAKTPTLARHTHPSGEEDIVDTDGETWPTDPTAVSVVYLGSAKRGTKPGVICASFNAG